MKRTAKETVIQVPVSKLTSNPWGLEVGPPLADEDYERVRLSIKRDGVQMPLIVWKRGKRLVVLSGANRLRIAKELGLKTVPVIVRDFADTHAAKMFAISDNLARRQMTTGQRAYLAYQYQQLLAVGSGRRTKSSNFEDFRLVAAGIGKRRGVRRKYVSHEKDHGERRRGTTPQHSARQGQRP